MMPPVSTILETVLPRGRDGRGPAFGLLLRCGGWISPRFRDNTMAGFVVPFSPFLYQYPLEAEFGQNSAVKVEHDMKVWAVIP